MLLSALKVINKKTLFVNNFLPSELFSIENEPIIRFLWEAGNYWLFGKFLQICISFVHSKPIAYCYTQIYREL